MPVLGIDVSHHQGNVNWHRVAQSDFKFAYMKASEGSTFVDSKFQKNWTAARDEGLLHGAYHFARPGGDPETQAAHFAAVVGPSAWGELPPALDLETADGLPAQAVIQWTLAFVRRAEALLGRPLMIYTGALWRTGLGNPNVPELGTRLLWTARYSMQPPKVPKTWAQWDIWQFTEGKNGEVLEVPGVAGHCDCDRFRGTLEELNALAIGGATPGPVVPDEPTDGAPPWPGQHFVWPHQPVIRNEHVRMWQAQVRERGFVLDVDGAYGPESKQACISFQREVGLVPDGIVGRKTWAAAFTAL